MAEPHFLENNRGLTLLELVIALAMLVVVASLALPPLGGASQRARLKGSAEALAGDLAEARFEAARRGQALYVDFHAGADWCWSVATAPGCGCGAAQSCQLKTERAGNHAGIALVDSQGARFDPTAALAVDTAGGAVFQSPHGEQLRVGLSALGRASICAPAAPVPGYNAC